MIGITDENTIEKTCNGCIHLRLYVGSSTGKCGIHCKNDKWIGTNEPSCGEYWPSTKICLTCKHWDSVKFKDRPTHWGMCQLTSLGNGAHKCDCYCSKWESRPNLKEYLDTLTRDIE